MNRLMPYLGWIANVFLVFGLWLAGNRWPYAFALTAIGELLWAVKTYRLRQWDMLFICVAFALLAMRNLWLWTIAG